jgi:DNA-binding transcriptional regulator YdaS (Cro superfamily)
MRVARALSLNEQYLYQCLSGKKPMPAHQAPLIERETGARYGAEQLCPAVRWVRVPDPAWPHPMGRPCIDVAAPAES